MASTARKSRLSRTQFGPYWKIRFVGTRSVSLACASLRNHTSSRIAAASDGGVSRSASKRRASFKCQPTTQSGETNPKYDQIPPRDAQKYLCRLWACIGAKLIREGIAIYGFRIAEPQHDGTPHWHFLLFMSAENAQSVETIMRKYALAQDGNEPGAREHRFKAVAIDYSKGTAAGYVAKYVSKNIDGFGIEQDLDGNDSKSSAQRVDAWAATWGIRQFQQIGGPPVTLWRELRRLGGAPEGGLAEAWEAADTGNWKRFVELMGGAQANRKDHPIRISRHWNDRPGCYREPVGWQIFGVECGSTVCPTRLHTWTVVRQSAQADNELSAPIVKRRDELASDTGEAARRDAPPGRTHGRLGGVDTLLFTDAT